MFAEREVTCGVVSNSYNAGVLNLSPELQSLPNLTPRLVQLERREVFSLHPEIRGLAWGGALLVAAAAALLIKNNVDVLGVGFVAVAIGVAAAACYAWAWRNRGRVSVVDDYVLLLGALLLSTDAAFIEQQFDLFGAHGERQFLLLAVVHAVVAYLFDSRLVLTLSVSAMAAWIGVEHRGVLDYFDRGSTETAIRLFTCALAAVTWREGDRHFRQKRTFERPLEHFTANFVLLAGLTLTGYPQTRLLGVAVTIVAAALAVAWGLRKRAESFVLYGFLYAVFAFDIFVDETLRDEALVLLTICLSALGAIIGLFVIHARFQRSET
jgi:hypothetical protein